MIGIERDPIQECSVEQPPLLQLPSSSDHKSKTQTTKQSTSKFTNRSAGIYLPRKVSNRASRKKLGCVLSLKKASYIAGSFSQFLFVDLLRMLFVNDSKHRKGGVEQLFIV